MELYSYFRSSASYRVRIALNLKGITYDTVPVNLLKAEHKDSDYAALNPQQLLPTLVDKGEAITQSIAIIEYLEETHPEPPLLPRTPQERARVRALSLAIACETSPVNNLSVQRYLKEKFGADEAQKTAWIQHWIGKGFTAVESMLQSPQTGKYMHGDTPTMADCLLVPQLFNARRFGCDLSAFPTLVRIGETCDRHAAFAAAHPSKQPDNVA